MKRASALLAAIMAVLFCLHASGVKREARQIPLAIDSALSWNTFLGSGDEDDGFGIAVDTSGNIYVTGYSDATWGTPVRPFTGAAGNKEAFVAKLDASGALQWNTFLGGLDDDEGFGIAVDKNGSVYVTGYSYATWGTPVRPYTASDSKPMDAYVAKLGANGALQWNTFLGGVNNDRCQAIAVDTNGNSYVIGASYETWGSPIIPHGGGGDNVMVAKINTTGVLQWNTFLGTGGSSGSTGRLGNSIAVDTNGNSYVTGDSRGTWGSPINPFVAFQDAFVAKLNVNGIVQWNTFLGTGYDYGCSIALDTNGNSYVTGWSYETWGSPITPPEAGGNDVFVAKLDNNGVLQWNTFLGGSVDAIKDAYGIAVDTNGNSCVTGYCFATWGSPAEPFYGDSAGFVAKIDTNGILKWNTFLTGPNVRFSNNRGIALDVSGNSHVTGASDGTWGSPVRPFEGAFSSDAYVAKIPANPLAIDPEVRSLSRSGATACDPGFTLSVTGSDFLDGAVVKWDGSDRTTTFVNSSRLDAAIAASDLTTAKTVPITVLNPDDGLSNALDFSVSGFTMGASSSSATVTAGQSATYTIQVTPQYGSFDSSVSFNCTGLPSKCTATFSPTSAIPGANVTTTTLTLATKSTSSSGTGTIIGSSGLIPPGISLLVYGLGLLLLFRFSKPFFKQRLRRWLAAGAVVCLVGVIVACSSGGDDGNPPYTGTPKGTHQITVQGNSSCLTGSTTVTLVVK